MCQLRARISGLFAPSCLSGSPPESRSPRQDPHAALRETPPAPCALPGG
ncbi:splicing factor PWI domain-containing protein [Iris pallida]|uniref:Splicing factor PWI domain-containing protein n=1 Tax=Iris pallida TaxID=29817 RepID=A0AAX6E1Y3_IRIPA|nr:splicing factor PWI domain-containing protein [Iris pallida]